MGGGGLSARACVRIVCSCALAKGAGGETGEGDVGARTNQLFD